MRSLNKIILYLFVTIATISCKSSQEEDFSFPRRDPISIEIGNNSYLFEFGETELHPDQCFFYAELVVTENISLLDTCDRSTFTFICDSSYSKDAITEILMTRSSISNTMSIFEKQYFYRDFVNYMIDSITSYEISYINYYVNDLFKLKKISSENLMDLLNSWRIEDSNSSIHIDVMKELELLYWFFGLPEFMGQPNVKRHIKKIIDFSKSTKPKRVKKHCATSSQFKLKNN